MTSGSPGPPDSGRGGPHQLGPARQAAAWALTRSRREPATNSPSPSSDRSGDMRLAHSAPPARPGTGPAPHPPPRRRPEVRAVGALRSARSAVGAFRSARSAVRTGFRLALGSASARPAARTSPCSSGLSPSREAMPRICSTLLLPFKLQGFSLGNAFKTNVGRDQGLGICFACII